MKSHTIAFIVQRLACTAPLLLIGYLLMLSPLGPTLGFAAFLGAALIFFLTVLQLLIGAFFPSNAPDNPAPPHE